MNDFTFRNATRADWSAIAQLLRDSELPLDGAENHLNGFLLAFQGPALAGCAALERYGESALLRSVAVDKAHRGRGLGQELTRRMLGAAGEDGIRSVVLLTTTAASFFKRFGFEPIDRHDAPKPIHASEEFQGACPDSATTMLLEVARQRTA